MPRPASRSARDKPLKWLEGTGERAPASQGNKALRLAALATTIFSVTALAQPQATPQSTGANPPAGQAAIFHRAITMYGAKNYSPALRAFEESADAGNVEAM